MIALKTCKLFQTVYLAMPRWLVSSVPFIGQILKLTYQGHESIAFTHFLWPLVTSILTWPKKVMNKSCRSFNELSNAVYSLPLRFVVFEIWGGGAKRAPRPIPNLSDPVRNRVMFRVLPATFSLWACVYASRAPVAIRYGDLVWMPPPINCFYTVTHGWSLPYSSYGSAPTNPYFCPANFAKGVRKALNSEHIKCA